MDERHVWAKISPFQSIETHARVSGIISMILLQELLSVGLRNPDRQIGSFLLAFTFSSVYHTI